MKKYKFVLICLVFPLLLLSFSGCVPPWATIYPTPYGIWKSEEPELLFDFNPDVSTIDGTGEYIINGETVRIVALRFINSNTISIENADAFEGNDPDNILIHYFSGSFKIEDNKLIIALVPNSQKKTGYKQIILEKIGDYPEPEE